MLHANGANVARIIAKQDRCVQCSASFKRNSFKNVLSALSAIYESVSDDVLVKWKEDYRKYEIE